ncbi:MAG: hypothetical protein WEB37_11895, partial [Bacteroidota bacterium]
MLNYVWISLVIIGILVAAGNDIKDELANPYRNGIPLEGTILLKSVPTPGMKSIEGELRIPAGAFAAFYGLTEGQEVRQDVRIVSRDDGTSLIYIPVGE